ARDLRLVAGDVGGEAVKRSERGDDLFLPGRSPGPRIAPARAAADEECEPGDDGQERTRCDRHRETSLVKLRYTSAAASWQVRPRQIRPQSLARRASEGRFWRTRRYLREIVAEVSLAGASG